MAEWRPVPGFEEHYAVSDEGQVKRIGAPGRGTRPGAVLRYRYTTAGYPTFMACVECETHVVSIHRAVMIAFNSPPPFPEAEVNHKDGVRANCHKDNLEWVTSSQNKIHAYQTGMRTRKLTEEQISEIRTLYGSGGVSQTELAHSYGVSQRMVSMIVRKEIYAFTIPELSS